MDRLVNHLKKVSTNIREIYYEDFEDMNKELNAKLKILKNTALIIIPHLNIFVLFQIYEYFYFPKF